MRVVVAGSRAIVKATIVENILEYYLDEVWAGMIGDTPEFVTGGAQGVDTLAHEYLEKRGAKCIVMNADWDTVGKGAGHIRNEQMIRWALDDEPYGISATVGIITGKSTGTKHTIKRSVDLGVTEVHVHRIR